MKWQVYYSVLLNSKWNSNIATILLNHLLGEILQDQFSLLSNQKIKEKNFFFLLKMLTFYKEIYKHKAIIQVRYVNVKGKVIT